MIDVEIDATHLTLRGDGVGEWDGRAVHVPGLFAGERARVRIEHRSKQQPRAHGRVLEILTAHPARRAAPCPQHGPCGGCPLMELPLDAQREQKRGMLAALGLDVDRVVGAERALGYRWSSKRVAFRADGGLRLGSWRRGTHKGASMRGCLVDHPRIAAAFDELEDAARALGVTPYHEKSGQGALRYAWAKTDGERVLLTIHEAEEGAVDRGLADALSGTDGVAFTVSAGRGNAIRAGVPALARGLEAIEVGGQRIGPGGFLQPNPEVIAAARADLIADEAGGALAGALAWDLYAGAGATSRALGERFARVEAVESDPALTDAPRAVEAFLDAVPEGAAPPDLVVANPPRKGLRPAVAAALVRIAPSRIHVMACGPEGLARDLAALDGYDVLTLTAWDSLPQTPHVEVVAKLIRRGAP